MIYCNNCIYWHKYVVNYAGYCAINKMPTSYDDYCEKWRLSGEEKENERKRGENYE